MIWYQADCKNVTLSTVNVAEERKTFVLTPDGKKVMKAGPNVRLFATREEARNYLLPAAYANLRYLQQEQKALANRIEKFKRLEGIDE